MRHLDLRAAVATVGVLTVLACSEKKPAPEPTYPSAPAPTAEAPPREPPPAAPRRPAAAEPTAGSAGAPPSAAPVEAKPAPAPRRRRPPSRSPRPTAQPKPAPDRAAPAAPPAGARARCRPPRPPGRRRPRRSPRRRARQGRRAEVQDVPPGAARVLVGLAARQERPRLRGLPRERRRLLAGGGHARPRQGHRQRAGHPDAWRPARSATRKADAALFARVHAHKAK